MSSDFESLDKEPSGTFEPVPLDKTPLGYDETLNYSQAYRRQIVGQLMQRGVPGDVKEINTVLKALSDMDRTALEERKNSIDSQNADTSKAAAEAIREFIQGQKNVNPFERDNPNQPTGQVPHVDTNRLGNHTVVEGETEIGVVIENSADFMKRMDHIRQAQLADDE